MLCTWVNSQKLLTPKKGSVAGPVNAGKVLVSEKPGTQRYDNGDVIQFPPPWSPDSGDRGRSLICLHTLIADMLGRKKWPEQAGGMTGCFHRTGGALENS